MERLDQVLAHGHLLSVVVDKLNIVGTATSPHGSEQPLGVDADAVLTLAVTLQLLQGMPRRDPQILDLRN